MSKAIDLAANPALVNLIHGKLNELVGTSSGYVESLPKPVKDRVNALAKLQKDRDDLAAKHAEDMAALDKKYNDLCLPLYEKRANIISGTVAPTEEEINFKDSESESEESEEGEKPEKQESPIAEDAKGVPEFWLTCMKNHRLLSDLITEKDEEALKSLADIKVEMLKSEPGFKLTFAFEENKYFSNKTLNKTYFLTKGEDRSRPAELLFDRSEGTKIEWKSPELNLTVQTIEKKQRHKTTKQVRTVKETVPSESFFLFFSPPAIPENASDDSFDPDELEELEQQLEYDYHMGEIFKDFIVPCAVNWFTGKALKYDDDNEYGEYESEEDFDEDESEDDEDEDDDEDDSEDDEKEEKALKKPVKTNKKGSASDADCKQS